MELPLDPRLSIGIQTMHRRTEPADAPWRPTIDEMQALVRLVDDCGYDSLWVGDHIAFAVAILDPLLQLAQAAVVSPRLTLGTDAARARAGRGADGWLSYVVTPGTYHTALARIAAAAETAGRQLARFGTGHLLFTRLDDRYERALNAAAASLSRSYAMDFRRPA